MTLSGLLWRHLLNIWKRHRKNMKVLLKSKPATTGQADAGAVLSPVHRNDIWLFTRIIGLYTRRTQAAIELFCL